MERCPDFSESAAASEAALSPEILRECLLSLMHGANRGVESARDAAYDCIDATTPTFAGFTCKKAGCKLFVDNGTLYGADRCYLVQAGEMEVPVELR